jgi:uncharacterized protein (DUF1697 family)
MTRYAVFLRGVNVGGRTMPMAEVRRALSALPVENLATLLASGNVVCSFAGTAAELRAAVEATLRSSFGYDAWVVVLTAERLAELLQACPFPPDSADTHTYVTVASDPAALDELVDAVAEADPSAEQVRLGPEASAWTVPVGRTLESPRSKIASRARYRNALTDRNLRTMLKVTAALEKMADG